MRRLTKTLAVMSLLAPASAYSLGIGSIKVHSGLNQNLNAEIALIRSANEEVSDIKVSLAPPAKFDEAGIPWSAFLSKIKLESVVKANGSTVIKISSNEALKESFLDFLLEVSWPKGSLYREFTVLLEPPEYQKVSTSRVQTYQSFEEAPQPQPVTEQPRQRSEGEAPAPRPRRRHVAYVDRRHNVTRKHDTLWKVAERVRKDGEPTVEQMMIAIYQANPQAFYKDNINALLPNKKLNIPKKEDVLSLSQDQALVAFNEQMRAWKNNEPVAAHKEIPAEDAGVDKQLTLVAPTDAPVADDAATSLAHDSSSTPDKTADEKAKEGDANGQSGEAKDGVNVVAPGQDVKTDKVVELEKQLATMQKNLEQKEQQLQVIQNGGKPLPVVPENKTLTNGTEAATPVIKAPGLPTPPTVKPEIKPHIQNPLVETPVTDTTPLWLVGIGGGLLALIGWLWWRKRKFNEQFDGESMFAPSSMIKPDQATVKPVSKAASTPSAISAGPMEDNSFLNEFTASDFEVFDTSHVEIDPISETDVYLAYGRYQQAEELMRQAIKDQPDNDEYKLKLLEIFCATERKKDFVNYAAELAEAGKKDQAEFWIKVIEMGGEVWADLTLTSGGEMFISENDAAVENIYTHLAPVEQDAAEPEPVELDNDDLIDADREPSQFHVATFDSDFEESLLGPDSELFVPRDSDDGVSDFDLLSEFDTDVADHDLQNNESIEFDVGSLAGSTKNNTAQVVNAQAQATPFSLDKKELSLEDTHDIEMSDFSAEHDNIEAFDAFSVEGLTGSDDKNHKDVLEKDKPFPLTLEADQSDYDVADDFEFEFDFNVDAKSATTEPNAHYFEESDASFDFMDLDELETKLDLAKAYIDMGDSEAAKEIIAEVLDKGNKEQVKTARNLFDSLV